MNTTLDYSGKTQLYYQIYYIFKNAIANNDYKVGDFLPTELAIASTYNVSRITVRKAMDLMVQNNLIKRKRGYGTIVIPQRIEQTLSSVIHFSDEMQKKGYSYSTKMLCNELIPAEKEIANALNLEIGRPLIHISRIRYSNDVPMCIENVYLIYEEFPKVYGIDFSTISLRKTLYLEHNLQWQYATENIFAINSNQKNSEELNIPENSALLYIERLSFAQDGLPKEFLKCFHRGDSYYFNATLPIKNL